MEMMKILLAEDDPNLGLIIREYFEAKGFHTQLCSNGEEALKQFSKEKWNICIFDVMMPQMDGFTLAREIRKLNNDTPIVFLTAKSMKEDTIEGFKSGADDYITKPFSMEELLLRIKAILKRTEKSTDDEQIQEFRIGNYQFKPMLQLLTLGNQVHKLTSRESDLLRLLCLNMNNTLERNFALKAIWSDDNYFNARSMDVYIARLRKYLTGDDNIEILNVHGKGFKLLDKTMV
jgi:two-component system OmpR family response regulator